MTPDATAAPPARTPVRHGPAAARAGRRTPRLASAFVLAAALALGGCGVRLETPVPTEPSPDAHEVVRRTAVDDALAVSALVAEVAPTVTAPEVLAVLTQAGNFADRHAEALGGEYDSGLDVSPEPAGGTSGTVTTTSPEGGAESPEGGAESPEGGAESPGRGGDEAGATPTTDPGPVDTTVPGPTTAVDDPGPATTEDVVAALVGASQRARASADSTRDGELARLLGSIATSEHVSALRLAAVTDSAGAAELPGPTPPVQEAPGGVGAADLATVVAAEDAAGYAYEVRAAQSDGDVRTRAVGLAAQHRSRAQAWAVAAGTDGTDQDPRRAAYVVPDGEDAVALGLRLETELAQSYASIVATAAPQSRETALGLLTDSWLAALTWGAAPVPFPGLAEQSAP